MKPTKSKQFLADAIHASGKGWRHGAISAAQCKSDMSISFYSDKPYSDGGIWRGNHIDGADIPCSELHPNWHQAVLSREEYYHAHPKADADGWIEWKGGECPVDDLIEVEVKLRNHRATAARKAKYLRWTHDESLSCADIIAYRLHKPEFKPESNTPEPEANPTIEQLAADYRNAKDCALRLQEEANNAWTAAENAKGELIDAGKAIGLVLSVADSAPMEAKFTGRFHSAKHGDRPSDLGMVCDGCGERFGYHVGFACRP